jgi:hypothetical protein
MANMDLFGNWSDVFALVGKNEHPSAVIWGALDEVGAPSLPLACSPPSPSCLPTSL